MVTRSLALYRFWESRNQGKLGSAGRKKKDGAGAVALHVYMYDTIAKLVDKSRFFVPGRAIFEWVLTPGSIERDWKLDSQ